MAALCFRIKVMNEKEILQHRRALLSEGTDATFEVPLRFSKAFIGEFVNPAGEKKVGRIIEGIASTELMRFGHYPRPSKILRALEQTECLVSRLREG